LCAVQDWVKQTGERIIVLFEGRDAAGKLYLEVLVAKLVGPYARPAED
jgi:polyphosphate kinase 2 (PPK2 family)